MQKRVNKRTASLATKNDLLKWKKIGFFVVSIILVILIFAIFLQNSQNNAQKSNIPQENTPTRGISSPSEAQYEDNEKTISGESYTIVSVVDGDTVKIEYNGKLTSVRLIGIDTPETVHSSKPVECYGPEASDQLKDMLTGKTVIMESDDSQGNVDSYGRLLRYIWLDGININEYMILYGYAREYTYKTPYKYQDRFKKAESNAKLTNIGLWKNCPTN